MAPEHLSDSPFKRMYPTSSSAHQAHNFDCKHSKCPKHPIGTQSWRLRGVRSHLGTLLLVMIMQYKLIILKSLEDVITHNHHHRLLYHHHHGSTEDRSHDHVGKRVAICRDSCAQSSSAKKDPLPVFIQSSVYICIYPFLCVLFNPSLSSWHEQ